MLHVITITLDAASERISRVTKRDLKAMIAGPFEIAVVTWWNGYAELRFKPYARAKLGYRIKEETAKRKERYGAKDPLVWTGELRSRVLSRSTVKIMGSAANMRGVVNMGRTPHNIVLMVLETVPEDEVKKTVEPTWLEAFEELLDQLLETGTAPRSHRKPKLSPAGARSSIAGGGNAERFRRAQERMMLARADAQDFAQDLDIRQEEGRARAQNALKRTHDRWRRSAGGSAPGGAAGWGMSRTYLGSARHRHAQAQRRYRERIRQRR